MEYCDFSLTVLQQQETQPAAMNGIPHVNQEIMIKY